MSPAGMQAAETILAHRWGYFCRQTPRPPPTAGRRRRQAGGSAPATGESRLHRPPRGLGR
ncbi:hypothetical protein ACP70R_041988 [Stipagrostis hirtigluma subsp. patula]